MLFDLTGPEVGIEMGNPDPQGDKFLRWLDMVRDPAKGPYVSGAFLPPGRVNMGSTFPDFAGIPRPVRLVGAGTGSENSQKALTALKFNDPGKDSTGRRLPAMSLDLTDMTLEDLVIVGPSKTSQSGQAPAEGVGVFRPKGGMLQNVGIHGFFAGEEWVNDHQWSRDIDLRGNGCAIHYAQNRGSGRGGLGDQHIVGKNHLTDCTIASFLVHPYASIANLHLEGGHSGMCPYWILGYDPTDPNFPVFFNPGETLDQALIRALVDGFYSDAHSREAANGIARDMLGTRTIRSMDFHPTNESGTFTQNQNWYWPALPARAGIDVAYVERLRFHFQGLLIGPKDPVTGERRPAIRAKKVSELETGDFGPLLTMLKGNTGQLIEYIPGSPNGERPHIHGVNIGGLHGGDRIGAAVGRGDIGQYELVQENHVGEVLRHDASSDHGCVGVNLRACTDNKACHYAVRIKANTVRIRVWHPPSDDPAFPATAWPAGTLLKPSADHPGCATRAEGEGDGQIVGKTREACSAGESTPICQIEV